MLVLSDWEAEVVITRLEHVEQLVPEYAMKNEYGRTFAEQLEAQFEHSKGKEF